MAQRRVVITGMGAITPLGLNVQDAWQNLMACNSGVERISLFDAGSFPTTFAAEIRDFDLASLLPPDAQDHRQAGRQTQFILGAALEAWRQARLPLPLSDNPVGGDPAAERVGVYLGAGEGPLDWDNFVAAIVDGWQADKKQMDWQAWARTASARMNPVRELEQEPNMPSAHLAQLFRVRGPIMSCLTACAASTQAVGEATELIRCGDADVVLTGGAHSMIHPLGVTGFNRLTALSTRNDDPKHASRPFDAERDGFVLAEGAGAVILESLESAQRRGVSILAEIIGYGTTADAFRVTDQHETGRGGIAAVQKAMEDAAVGINDIDYISAHGTGTVENDSIETLVIRSVFGERAYQIPVSSVKSMLGHLIAAAGVVELITCVLALRDQVLPPTTNYANPDPQCDLDYVPNHPRPARVEVVMSNSFGFGGQNNTIILRKFSG